MTNTPTRKEINRGACGHTQKEVKIMGASGAIEDINRGKSGADSRGGRKSSRQTSHALGIGAKGYVFRRTMRVREPERTWNRDRYRKLSTSPILVDIPLITMTPLSAAESTEKVTP